MKTLGGTVLALLAAAGGSAIAAGQSAAGDYGVQHVVSARYVQFQNLEQCRWPNATVAWWYNPNRQLVGTEQALAAIQEATAAWERISGVRFTYMGITSKEVSSFFDDTLVIGWLDGDQFEAMYGYYGAYAQVWWDGERILDGEVALNAGMGAIGIADLRGLVTHELGHILGLDHSDVAASIMYARPYHNLRYQQFPREDDIYAARALYPGGHDCSGAHGVVVTAELDVHLPTVRLGPETYWADLTRAADGSFEVRDFGLYATPFLGGEQCAGDASMSPELRVSAPLVFYGEQRLWGELRAEGVRNERRVFQLDGYGPL